MDGNSKHNYETTDKKTTSDKQADKKKDDDDEDLEEFYMKLKQNKAQAKK